MKKKFSRRPRTNPLLDDIFWATATPQTVREAIRQGAKATARDQDGVTPLHLAAARNTNPEVIRVLVELGAEVNARDERGRVPLHSAATALLPNPDTIKLLVELGAEVNARDPDGWTPLHWAAFLSSSSEIVITLLELGADHMARTAGKKIALDFIVSNETLIHSRAFQRLYDLRFSQGLL